MLWCPSYSGDHTMSSDARARPHPPKQPPYLPRSPRVKSAVPSSGLGLLRARNSVCPRERDRNNNNDDDDDVYDDDDYCDDDLVISSTPPAKQAAPARTRASDARTHANSDN